MERALKERIIGAIVLVVFVVLVVPVFLDGPPTGDEVISEPFHLPGQQEQPVKVIVLDRDRTEPVPSGVEATTARAAVAQEPESEPKPEPVTETEPGAKSDRAPDPEPDPPVSEPETRSVEAPKREPADEPPQREPPKIQRSAGSATGMWAVQLGSFSSAENANRLAANLRQNGFAAFLSKTVSDGQEMHRVRIGPQKDKPSAEAMASRLKDAGHNGRVVPHP